VNFFVSQGVIQIQRNQCQIRLGKTDSNLLKRLLKNITKIWHNQIELYFSAHSAVNEPSYMLTQLVKGWRCFQRVFARDNLIWINI